MATTRRAILTFRDACGVGGCTETRGEWTSIVTVHWRDSILWTCLKGHRTIVHGDLTLEIGEPLAMVQGELWEDVEVEELAPPPSTSAMDRWLSERPIRPKWMDKPR